MPSILTAVPVGLLGFEMRTARVVGLDRVEQFFERERERFRAVIELADARARDFGVEPVHRVGRAQDDDFVVVIDVGVDQHLDGFVGAVGEQHLVSATLK